MDRRVPYTFGSTLLLIGAFVVGGALHEAFVQGSVGVTSPLFVLGLVVGSVVVYTGWRIEREFDPSEMVPGDEEEEEFDEAASPISASDLEGRERDDSYDG